jgi:preprotein translocase subunit SecG
MQTVLFVVHLILAIALAAIVLLQRSEGGALGIGGGGGGGLVSSRGAGNMLTKITWTLAALFMLNSIVLTMLAGGSGGEVTSVFSSDPTPVAPVEQPAPAGPSAPVSE